MNWQTRSARSTAILGVVMLILIMIPAFGPAASDLPEGPEFEAYGQISHFTWKEYSGGEKLLEESGPILAAGGQIGLAINPSLAAEFSGEIFGGTVDYDGQTQPSQGGDPVTTDTDYIGVKLEADFNWDLMPEAGYELGPFAGFGIRAWEREIQDAAYWDAGNQQIQIARGYTETWRHYYGRAGFSGARQLSPRVRAFLVAGVKIPVYTENKVDLNDSAVILLEPENRVSGFAELGMESGMFKISIFYEGLRFDRSDPVYFYDGTDYGVAYQPESEADIFGINAGVKF